MHEYLLLIDFKDPELDQSDITDPTVLQYRCRTNVLQETIAASRWEVHSTSVPRHEEFKTFCSSLGGRQSQSNREESD